MATRKECIYADRETATLDLAEYIDSFYNPARRHSYLGGVSPNEFEAAHRKRKSGVHRILVTPEFGTAQIVEVA